ncbi:MAG TPA: thiamine pyrophosphate-dependent enzyme [Dehalococcoidia bacterium]|nr:thiamine pyrophosphate-dependent enzyme [Dehalococcoidia bacterium]
MTELFVESHPLDVMLRADRLPHIWCPGCGLGAVTEAYAKAIEASELPVDQHVCVSGIGCTGRVAGYLNIDSFHTTHGRAIPFATGLKVARPELEVSVMSGDGDLFAIGGNHFIHAARRNIDINVFCVNNFNYGMTGGQGGPTTPRGSFSTTTPMGSFDDPFNLPKLAIALGAVYVARWTSLHVRQMQQAMDRALEKRGFTFVEILAPCPVGYGKSNDIGEGIDEMRLYRDHCVIEDGASPDDLQIDLTADAPIVLGTFVDTERRAFGVAAGEG